MAPALDASTPAFVAGTTNPGVTASFTPPAGSKLVAMALADQNNTFTITGGGLTWTVINSTNDGTNGASASWWADVATSAAMTVSVTKTGSFTALAVKVIVLTGAATGASGIGAKSANNVITQTVALTLTSSNSWVWAAVEDNNAVQTGPATNNTAVEGPTAFGGIGGMIVRSTANPTGASGASFTVGTAGATRPALVAFEVVGSGTAAPAVARYPRFIDRPTKLRVLR